jgi:UDP-2,4-diacetamido-2,4,6-trideoxy-beta-L-altropyranose hydrolase
VVGLTWEANEVAVNRKATLLLRADASVAAGTGHVMRCLALAQAWQNAGGRAVFAMAETTAAVRARLASESVEVVPIGVQAAGRDDARRVTEWARHYRADWVVIDGYFFDPAYVLELKSAGLKVLLIDDEGLDRPCGADLILNQNFNATRNMYPQREDRTRLLLGMRYVLLRNEFLAWRDFRREPSPTARKILVTMGGSDPDNLTGLVIQALSMVTTEGVEATVVAGGSNPHLDFLGREASRSRAAIQLQHSCSNMPELMARADLAIIAAGGTLWELLYMSCPVLSFGRTPVQQRILGALHERGIVQHLGDPRHVVPSALALAIDQLAASPARRAKMAELGRQQIDGEGARRVCELLAEGN